MISSAVTDSRSCLAVEIATKLWKVPEGMMNLGESAKQDESTA